MIIFSKNFPCSSVLSFHYQHSAIFHLVGTGHFAFKVIASFCPAYCHDVFDLKIYIETSNEIRRERFMKRAIEERNQTEENALKQWDYIVNAGIKYVQPGRNYADFVLDGNVNLQYFDKILEYIHAITNNFQ